MRQTVPLVLSASQGDAWLHDADEGMAACLAWLGEPQDCEIEDVGNDIEVGWDGAFALDGDAFTVETQHPAIGTRRILGYPLGELRLAIDKAQSFDKRFGTLMAQEAQGHRGRRTHWRALQPQSEQPAHPAGVRLIARSLLRRSI
jgi:hypothetical protein